MVWAAGIACAEFMRHLWLCNSSHCIGWQQNLFSRSCCQPSTWSCNKFLWSSYPKCGVPLYLLHGCHSFKKICKGNAVIKGYTFRYKSDQIVILLLLRFMLKSRFSSVSWAGDSLQPFLVHAKEVSNLCTASRDSNMNDAEDATQQSKIVRYISVW